MLHTLVQYYSQSLFNQSWLFLVAAWYAISMRRSIQNDGGRAKSKACEEKHKKNKAKLLFRLKAKSLKKGKNFQDFSIEKF